MFRDNGHIPNALILLFLYVPAQVVESSLCWANESPPEHAGVDQILVGHAHKVVTNHAFDPK